MQKGKQKRKNKKNKSYKRHLEDNWYTVDCKGYWKKQLSFTFACNAVGIELF